MKKKRDFNICGDFSYSSRVLSKKRILLFSEGSETFLSPSLISDRLAVQLHTLGLSKSISEFILALRSELLRSDRCTGSQITLACSTLIPVGITTLLSSRFTCLNLSSVGEQVTVLGIPSTECGILINIVFTFLTLICREPLTDLARERSLREGGAQKESIRSLAVLSQTALTHGS